jgi:hypothetical protein
MQTITITVSPDGTPKIEVNGVKGQSCKDVTKAVEKALGTVSTDKDTPEMYERPQQNHVSY